MADYTDVYRFDASAARGEMAQLQRIMVGLGQSAEETGGKLKSGGTIGNQGLIELGRGLQDLQYGFAGVANNLTHFVEMMAANGGMGNSLKEMGRSLLGAGGAVLGANLLAIGIEQVIKHKGEILEFFGQIPGFAKPAAEGIEGIQEKLTELGKKADEFKDKKNLDWFDLRKLRDTREEVKELTEEMRKQRELQLLMEGKSEAQSKRSSAFKAAVAETPGGYEVALSATETALERSGLPAKEAQKQAETLFADASQGSGYAYDEIRRLHKEAFPRGTSPFERQLRIQDPRTVQASEDAMKVAEADNKRLDDDAAARQADIDRQVKVWDQIDAAKVKEIDDETDRKHQAVRDRDAAVKDLGDKALTVLGPAAGDVFGNAGPRGEAQALAFVSERFRQYLSRLTNSAQDAVDAADLAAADALRQFKERQVNRAVVGAVPRATEDQLTGMADDALGLEVQQHIVRGRRVGGLPGAHMAANQAREFVAGRLVDSGVDPFTARQTSTAMVGGQVADLERQLGQMTAAGVPLPNALDRLGNSVEAALRANQQALAAAMGVIRQQQGRIDQLGAQANWLLNNAQRLQQRQQPSMRRPNQNMRQGG